MLHRVVVSFLVGLSVVVLGSAATAWAEETSLSLPGLESPVRVVTDNQGVRHIYANNDLDSALAQGWVQARDRFFQMDLTRRQVGGRLAELLGSDLIPGDIQGRTLGLQRAAERSAAVLTDRERAILEKYSDGVNAYLASNPLPIEYGALEITEARPWTVVDSLAAAKGIAAGLSLDIDTGLTQTLQAYVAAGAAGGFDGQALFFEDVVRTAPMDPASTIPDATNQFPFVMAKKAPDMKKFLAKAGDAAERVREKAESNAIMAYATKRRDRFKGSNEWAISGAKSKTGRPLLANDPHLALNAPSTFYEIHLIVSDDPEQGSMNVSGVGFPGIPGVVLGQNERITWGATVNPMDVSDLFLDTLIVDPATTCAPVQALACIVSEGGIHPVVIQQGVEYQANVIGDGVPNNLVTVPLPPENQIIAWVPFRSFGPILDIGDASVLLTGGQTTAVVLQYTGFHATRELSTFLGFNRAQNLDDFQEALKDFDVGSQNFAYADDAGNIAYFTSAELPLRRDLERGVVAGGLPPFFIRDGAGEGNWVSDPAQSQGQAIPFAILPADEMPHTINPENGFFVNANNDPAGVSLDNNPLNQLRTGNPRGIFYLNPGFADGLRAGRIQRLIERKLRRGRKLSLTDMMAFQTNTQQLDAELMTPHLIRAVFHGYRWGAPEELRDLVRDPRVFEAFWRMALWDYSSPTGIPEGYDASDFLGNRHRHVRGRERWASVSATLYNVWRGKLVQRVIDDRLASVGLPNPSSRDALKATFNLLEQRPFTGVGVSGIDFFPGSASSAGDRRDIILLSALVEALDALASDEFAPAFGNSTKMDDYRWGKLHRITFDHPLGGPFSIPPAGGFDNLSDVLTGVSRDGGYEVVNASSFSARADTLNGFKFGSGPSRRYVGITGSKHWHQDSAFGVFGFNVIPGGSSGDPTSPGYAQQLGRWLTGDYHFVPMGERTVRSVGESVEVLMP